MNDSDGQFFYHPLENIEDVDIFYDAVERQHLTRKVSPERPYTYWTIELYDQENGVRGGGGLGILAADTRRVAEQMGVPMALITPFYQSESHQRIVGNRIIDEHCRVDYKNFGFRFIDNVYIKCCGNLCNGAKLWRIVWRIKQLRPSLIPGSIVGFWWLCCAKADRPKACYYAVKRSGDFFRRLSAA